MTEEKPFVKLENTDATVTDEDGESRVLMAGLWGRIRDPAEESP